MCSQHQSIREIKRELSCPHEAEPAHKRPIGGGGYKEELVIQERLPEQKPASKEKLGSSHLNICFAVRNFSPAGCRGGH
jgi:hypothetical protein